MFAILFFFFSNFLTARKLILIQLPRFPDCNLNRLNSRPGTWFLAIGMVHVKCRYYKFEISIGMLNFQFYYQKLHQRNLSSETSVKQSTILQQSS